MSDKLLTVKEAAQDYFQGKVSERAVYALFDSGELRGFRVGTGKGKILIYQSSLEAYRLAHENGAPEAAPPPPPQPTPGKPPTIRLSRLPLP